MAVHILKTLSRRSSIDPAVRRYVPEIPWPKQQFVLNLKCREIFFGGAKGPGKTSLLLMCALRYVHIPGYACLILRKTTKEAKQANSIMDRLERWTKTDITAQFNKQDSTFRFPSGAMIKFGYIDNPSDRYQYQSSEYTTIIWDELSQFRLGDGEENPYLFMFGMNRKPEIGVDPRLAEIPCQVISASNPGGISHTWVKNRFVTDEALAAISDPTPRAFYVTQDRCFVPGKITDNPAIDAKKYVRESLSHLAPVTRERYVNGDWTIQENSIINAEWLRYYTTRGLILEPLRPNGDMIPHADIDERECWRFTTTDTAGTSEEKARESKGDRASWSVVGVWDYDQKKRFLYLRHVWRARVGAIDLMAGIEDVYKTWKPATMFIENAHIGPALSEFLRAKGLPVEQLTTFVKSDKGESGKVGKIERSVGLQNMLNEGRVFLPANNTDWLPVFEGELISWTGHKDEPDDQVDIASHAANVVERKIAGGAGQQLSGWGNYKLY